MLSIGVVNRVQFFKSCRNHHDICPVGLYEVFRGDSTTDCYDVLRCAAANGIAFAEAQHLVCLLVSKNDF